MAVGESHINLSETKQPTKSTLFQLLHDKTKVFTPSFCDFSAFIVLWFARSLFCVSALFVIRHLSIFFYFFPCCLSVHDTGKQLVKSLIIHKSYDQSMGSI